jgi:hypothetical protein
LKDLKDALAAYTPGTTNYVTDVQTKHLALAAAMTDLVGVTAFGKAAAVAQPAGFVATYSTNANSFLGVGPQSGLIPASTATYISGASNSLTNANLGDMVPLKQALQAATGTYVTPQVSSSFLGRLMPLCPSNSITTAGSSWALAQHCPSRLALPCCDHTTCACAGAS